MSTKERTIDKPRKMSDIMKEMERLLRDPQAVPSSESLGSPGTIMEQL